ncbi:MAG: L,D-transpeptidase family protein [Candidatus Promineifilaceae bacterium]|nr:L,D-transpeptidase family protein [Candidatus Promineifilaceae bacterium]
MSRKRVVTERKTNVYQREPSPSRAVPAPIHVPAPARAARRSCAPLLFVLLLASGLAVLAAGLFFFYLSDIIIPGVQTVGVPLGGESIDRATERLERDWAERRVTLTHPEHPQLQLPIEQLGFLLDARTTAERAHRQGRDPNDLAETLAMIRRGEEMEPTWYFNPAAARAALQAAAPSIQQPPTNASLRFVQGESGVRVEAVPAQVGSTIDVDATASWLQANAHRVARNGELPLAMRPVEPAVTDVDQLVAAANALLDKPLSITTFDPIRNQRQQTALPPSVWTAWIEPVVGDGGQSVDWTVDTDAGIRYLQQHLPAVGSERYLDDAEAAAALRRAIEGQQYQMHLRVYHHDRQHVVRSGETLSSIARDYGIPYPWIQQANSGSGDALYVGQTIIIPSPDRLLPLPIVENKRIVVSIAEQRMWAYENGAVKWEWPVSTGIDESPTAPGIFQIQSHEREAYASRWDLWMPYFMGVYRPVPNSDFMNGFHGFPTRNGYNLLWTNSLGRQVTYGCILVSNVNVVQLYDWADEGVVVEVRQ